MSGNAFLLTKRRLIDAHYLDISLREARDMHKPPITMTNFWKHAENYDDISAPLHDILAWLDREASAGDILVLEGDPRLVAELTDYAKAHQLLPVRPEWEPEAAIREL